MDLFTCVLFLYYNPIYLLRKTHFIVFESFPHLEFIKLELKEITLKTKLFFTLGLEKHLKLNKVKIQNIKQVYILKVLRPFDHHKYRHLL